MATHSGFNVFADRWDENARLALDTIAMRPARGIPTWLVNAMPWSHLENLSGSPAGSYKDEPVRVYTEFQRTAGVCFIDQWIPENPLSMRDQGYEADVPRTATTGAEEIVVDGMWIDSPEAVVEHMETHLFPKWQQWAGDLEQGAEDHVRGLIGGEVEVQQLFGMNMLKGPYGGFFAFPGFLYGMYGYANYFMAYQPVEKALLTHMVLCSS